MGLFSAIRKSKRLAKNSETNAPAIFFTQEKVRKKFACPFIEKPFTDFPSKCIQKWQRKILNTIFHWLLIFSLDFIITSYIKLQYFKFKFLHHILSTNHKLVKLKHVDYHCARSVIQLRKPFSIFSANVTRSRQGPRSIFWIGTANSCIVGANERGRRENCRGIRGHAPPENFEI